jgi:hypothetical protein
MQDQPRESPGRPCKVGRGTSVGAAATTFGLLVVLGAMPSATADREPSSAHRFPCLQDEPLTQYRAFRRMHATNERFNQEAWLDAWTDYDGRAFSYQIVSERGSGSIRDKVLRPLLRREQELIAHGDAERAGLTALNYEFEDTEGKGDGLRYVLLKPKRKDVLLVDGRMVLSQDGRELLRVEGRLSKNPSFWTSLVNVIRQYERLDGVRVPVSTESIAKVKFAGVSHLNVHYEYETINGRAVSLSARRTLDQIQEVREVR